MIKLTQTIKQFRKVVRYKINIENPIVFLYTNNKQGILLRKTSLMVTTKKIKYLGINLTRNYETCKRKTFQTLKKHRSD